jgi:UPF0716 protein FxsA
MMQTNLFIPLLKKDNVYKALFVFLLAAFLFLCEVFLIVYLGDSFGVYLILGITAATGLFGVLVALFKMNSTVNALKKKINEGVYPGREFIKLAGIMIGGLLFVLPGLITDVIGFLLFLPFLRTAVGRFATKRLNSTFKEIYEYMKLEELK